MAAEINPQLADILDQLSQIRSGIDSLFAEEQTDKKDQKKKARELVKVRIDDIKDSALQKISDTLGDISDTTKKGAKGKKEEDEKSGGFLKAIGGAIGDFVGTAFGTAAKAGGPYAALLALGIGGGIALTALGIAGAIRIIAPALKDIYGFIKDVLPEFGKFIKDLLPAFAQFINDVLGGEGFLKFIHVITDFWRNVLKDFFQTIPVIIMGIGEAIKTVMEGVSEILAKIPDVVKAISTGVATVLKPVTEMIEQIISNFIKTLPMLLAQIPPIIKSILPFFKVLMDFAKDTVHVIIDFAKYLIDNLPTIKEFLAPIIDMIRDLASKYIDLLKTAILSLKDVLVILIEKGLNPLIVGLRDVLISLFENLQKIIESLATVIISLGNNIQDILIPIIHVLDKTLMGIIDTIKLVIDKGFSLLETALNTINDVIKNIISFFETMPGKIADFIKSVVSSVSDLANISAADLLEVAGGITAISAALAVLGGGSLIKGFFDLFSKDPVKQLQRFVDLKDGLKGTADSVKLLAESLKMLGADGLGKAISANLKEVGEAIKGLPVQGLQIASQVTTTSKATPPATATAATPAKNETLEVLTVIKDAISNQLQVAVNSNTALQAIVEFLDSYEPPTAPTVMVNQPRTTSYSFGDVSTARTFRDRAAGA